MKKQTAEQLLDRLSAIAGDDSEINEIAVDLRQILVDEEVIDSDYPEPFEGCAIPPK